MVLWTPWVHTPNGHHFDRGPKEPCVAWGLGSTHIKGHFRGNTWGGQICLQSVFSTLFTRDSSNVASGYQHCSGFLLLVYFSASVLWVWWQAGHLSMKDLYHLFPKLSRRNHLTKFILLFYHSFFIYYIVFSVLYTDIARLLGIFP